MSSLKLKVLAQKIFKKAGGVTSHTAYPLREDNKKIEVEVNFYF